MVGLKLSVKSGYMNPMKRRKNQGSHFPAVSRISAKMKFQNPQKNPQLIREKKSGPIYF